MATTKAAMHRLRLQAMLALIVCLVPGCEAAAARLYTEEDPLFILGSGNIKPTLTNSTSAWLVQFYSSWCGHCIQYSSTWKALALDVKDWQQVFSVAVLDCAQEENFDVCKEYGIKFYPTFKYFKAHSPETERGTIYRGADREIQSVRQLMVNILQNHTKADQPDHCPPLEPFSSVDLLPLLGKPSHQYTAVMVEEPDSYVGREVILDMLQFSGVSVKRGLSSDAALLDRLSIASLPSVCLLLPNGTHTLLPVEKRLRFFFSSLLRALPGVQRRSLAGGSSPSGHTGALQETDTQPWRDFDRSKVYSADLESALHYLLRVELATHNALQGEELKIFKDFVTLVSKLYPGGGSVVKLMETLSDWLTSLPLQRIPYQAVLDLVNNKLRISGVYLGAELRWVGCQGSRAGLRGYPCALWTLFHVLTVQHDARPNALQNTGLDSEGAPVLQVMRRYIRTFFGCEECGRHFEAAAAASMDKVTDGQADRQAEVLWLWDMHNTVNYRLAGSLSDDPLFPKSPWPSPSLCGSCHEEQSGVHVWNRENVLLFLRQHYGAANICPKHSLTPPPHDPHPQINIQPDTVKTARPNPEPVGVKPSPGQQQNKDIKVDREVDTMAERERDTETDRERERHTETDRERERDTDRERETDRLTHERGGAVWILGLGFNSVDMSLCVLLYVCSCLFIMLLFCFFRVRHRRCKILRYSRLLV